MRPLPLLPFAALCFLALPAQAGNSDPGEAKAAYATADKALNQAYAKAKTDLPSELFAELQRDQREWIAYRDERAAEAAVHDGGAAQGKERENAEYWRTLSALTEERTAIVGGWLKRGSFAREWEGVWIDGRGGTLAILQSGEDEFDFALDVVRGPTYHLGRIDGKAKWNGGTARFSTEAPEGEGEAWLTFVKRGPKVEVVAENASGFHGARAYFDGHYLRIAELTDEDREALLSPEE